MFTKKKVKDPACGMEIKVKESTLRSHFQEKEYYFCSEDCLTKFESEPEKYVDFSMEDCCGGRHSGECKHNHKKIQHHEHCSNGDDQKCNSHGLHHHKWR